MKDLLGIKLVDAYTIVALVIAMLNFMKSLPACVSQGTGKNGSTVAVSYRSYVIRIIHHFLFGFFFYLASFKNSRKKAVSKQKLPAM